VLPSLISTAPLFEIDTHEMALGIFAAQKESSETRCQASFRPSGKTRLHSAACRPIRHVCPAPRFFHRQSDLEASAYIGDLYNDDDGVSTHA
jgi:hypothetical protein